MVLRCGRCTCPSSATYEAATNADGSFAIQNIRIAGPTRWKSATWGPVPPRATTWCCG
ncbi:MAG: hypothetical protein WKG07_11495 [Hymenobacter sp.]